MECFVKTYFRLINVMQMSTEFLNKREFDDKKKNMKKNH